MSKLLNDFGYSQVCANSVNSANIQEQVLTDTESPLHGDFVSELQNITITLAEVNTLLQEVRREQKNEKKNSNEDKLGPWKNCAELRALGDELSGGVQTVYPYFPNLKRVVVYCDQVTDGGGWTVIQSRSPLPVRESFERSWWEYVEGFGDRNGEYLLGLDNLHALTSSAQMELKVELEDWEGAKAWAKYETFHVGDGPSKYVLRIGNYTGDAGDGIDGTTNADNTNWNLGGMKFSTYDNDNDLDSKRNCADLYRGGWWFNKCYAAFLNGLPFLGKTPNDGGIHWKPFLEWHQMKKTSLKILPASFGV